MNDSKVLVIGSGVSGIAAASRLVENGFNNIVIVESENRIGGRIHTVSFGENVLDLGAQWCHGEKDNIVFDLANPSNLLESTGDVYEDYKVIRSNREIVDEETSNKLKQIVNDSVVRRREDLINYEGSLGNYLTEFFYSRLDLVENSEIDRTVAKEFLENYMKFENSVEASDTLFEVSGNTYLEYIDCEGDILLNWKDKGYIRFLSLLMKSNGTDYGILNDRILLNRTVSVINYDKIGDKKTVVVFTDGEKIYVDHVICTVSLGVLKEKHLSIFKPNLPAINKRAIEGIAFGTVNKIFLEFPYKFWPDDWSGFTLLWREEEELNTIKGTEKEWLEDVFGFYTVNYQPKVLASWIIGPHGRHMEVLEDGEVLEGLIWLLRKFLSFPVPAPSNFKTTKWYSNPNFRGSYSFRSLRTEELNTCAADLGSPIIQLSTRKPILQFGGEATSRHFYSTVHGAVEAGWREADRLINFYNALADPSSQL